MSIKHRRALPSALREAGNADSVAILRANLRCSDPRSRVRAVFALERIGNDAAIEALIDCLADEVGPHLTFAVRALGRIGTPQAITALAATLENRRTELCAGDKRLIIHALAKVPHRTEVPALEPMLSERSGRVRRAAAHALSQIRAQESQAALEQAVESLSFIRGFPARRALWTRRRHGVEE